MATLPVYDQTGKEVGSYEIDPAEIAPSINRQLLHDAVAMYQANLRQGTHRTKTRAEVKGSRKKMYRQKGTGNARAGHRMSGIRRGGGHMVTIRPRDYSYRLPRKALQTATRMAGQRRSLVGAKVERHRQSREAKRSEEKEEQPGADDRLVDLPESADERAMSVLPSPGMMAKA